MTLQQLRYVIQAADSRSMNEAAKALYISQPSLSGAIKELEKEIGIELFKRSSHGTVLTPEGEEFLGYARQVTDQYQLLENRYVYRTKGKKKFSVSMQHYSFAVKVKEKSSAGKKRWYFRWSSVKKVIRILLMIIREEVGELSNRIL